MTIYMIQHKPNSDTLATIAPALLPALGYFNTEEEALREAKRRMQEALESNRESYWQRALDTVRRRQWEWDMDTSADA